MKRVVHGGLVALLLVELAGIVWLVLNPSPAVPTRAVLDLSTWLTAQGVPARLADGDVVEFALNVALFVPLGLLCAVLFRRVPLLGWLAVGLMLSGLLELVQRELLPDRSSTLRDITANTTGMVLGAAPVVSWRLARTVVRRVRGMGRRRGARAGAGRSPA